MLLIIIFGKYIVPRKCLEHILENQTAVEAVQNDMSIRKAAIESDVKRSTLHDHVKGKHIKKAGMYSKAYDM